MILLTDHKKHYYLDMHTFSDRLLKLVYEKHSSVSACAIFMEREGCNINAQTLRRLTNGQWPSQKQLDMLCQFFDVEPECLLHGQCWVSRRHAYLMEDLSPNMQKIAQSAITGMLEGISTTAKDLDIR